MQVVPTLAATLRSSRRLFFLPFTHRKQGVVRAVARNLCGPLFPLARRLARYDLKLYEGDEDADIPHFSDFPRESDELSVVEALRLEDYMRYLDAFELLYSRWCVQYLRFSAYIL